MASTETRRDCGVMLDAVHRAMSREFAADLDDATYEHLLAVSDALFHRAALDDSCRFRRAASSERVRDVVARSGCRDVSAQDCDPFPIVDAVVPELVGKVGDGGDIEPLLTLLAFTDLPELGIRADATRTAVESAAMNWLGREADAGVTSDQVQAYLRSTQRFGGNVRSVRQLSGGFSKTTLLVDLDSDLDGETGCREVVLRQITPGRDSHTLGPEFDVLRFAFRHGVAVAKPLWIEPESNPLGGPFFASSRAAGDNPGDVFGARAGVEKGAGVALADALGHLHSVPTDGVPRTPVDPMVRKSDLLAAIEQQSSSVANSASRSNVPGHPLHALLFAWLRAHVPGDVSDPVLLHGDPGFHNMLVEGGNLTAMLDWERSRIGDSAQDLAYVRPYVRDVVPWDEFMDAYCAAGGKPPADDVMQFYTVWQDAWRFAGAYRARARLLEGGRGLLDGVLSLLHAPRFLLGALESAYGVTL